MVLCYGGSDIPKPFFTFLTFKHFLTKETQNEEDTVHAFGRGVAHGFGFGSDMGPYTGAGRHYRQWRHESGCLVVRISYADTGAITPYARLDVDLLPNLDTLSGNLAAYTDTLGNISYNKGTADISQPTWPNGMHWYAQSAHMMLGGGASDSYLNRPVYRFTADAAGAYDIDVTFRNCSSQGVAGYVHVVAGDVVIFTDDMSGFGADANATSTYTDTVTLAAGQTIEFTQSAYGSGDALPGPSYHIAAVDATITVPEPATLGLLAAGGLAFLRRRR